MAKILSAIIAALCALQAVESRAGGYGYGDYNCSIYERECSASQQRLIRAQRLIEQNQRRLEREIDFTQRVGRKFDFEEQRLLARMDREQEDAQRRLDQFLADPRNAGCDGGCSRYAALAAAVNRRAYAAQQSYDRWQQRKAVVMARYERRLERFEQNLSFAHDAFNDATADAENAQANLDQCIASAACDGSQCCDGPGCQDGIGVNIHFPGY